MDDSTPLDDAPTKRPPAEHLPQSIMVVDKEARILDLNWQFLRDLRSKGRKEDLVGKCIFDYISEEDHDRARRDFESAVDRGSAEGRIYSFIRGDGTEAAAEVSVNILGEGAVALVFGDVKGASGSECPVGAHKEGEARFHAFFDQAPLGYQSLGADGTILEVNQKWTEMTGYSREEAVGRCFGEFMAPVLAGFKTRFARFIREGEQQRAGADPQGRHPPAGHIEGRAPLPGRRAQADALHPPRHHRPEEGRGRTQGIRPADEAAAELPAGRHLRDRPRGQGDCVEPGDGGPDRGEGRRHPRQGRLRARAALLRRQEADTDRPDPEAGPCLRVALWQRQEGRRLDLGRRHDRSRIHVGGRVPALRHGWRHRRRHRERPQHQRDEEGRGRAQAARRAPRGARQGADRAAAGVAPPYT